MSKKLNLPALFTLIFATVISCSSAPQKAKYVPPTQVNQKLSDWDYDKIRQVRETEEAVTPHEEIPNDLDVKNCTVMTLAEMRRAKVTGCRPLDPRSGNGENSYCCPKVSDSSQK